MSSFLFITFSTLNLFELFFAILFRKSLKQFHRLKITNNICRRHRVFSFFNQKTFLRPICNIAFCKKVFIFWYSSNINNYVLLHVLLYWLTVSSNLSVYMFFDTEVIYLYIFFSKSLINLLATIDFSLLCVE